MMSSASIEFVYLASQSPRRAQLLSQLGVRHKLLLPDDGEDAEALEEPKFNELPLAYVKRVTALKLDAALARRRRRGLPAAPILCSDTTVAMGRKIFGKPASMGDAEQMLAALAGRKHRVLTAVAVQGLAGHEHEDGQRHALCSVSEVHFECMTPVQIQAYVATGEPMGKAGAYAVQGRAAVHITRISGSYSGIMGLPLYETAQLLRAAGLTV
jgi:septum formation protein